MLLFPFWSCALVIYSLPEAFAVYQDRIWADCSEWCNLTNSNSFFNVFLPLHLSENALKKCV